MQAFQPPSSRATGWCSLSTARPDSRHKRINRWAGGGCLFVPHSPGRAKRFRPYPSGRRHRRQ